MIPELGHFALIIALCLSILQAAVPFYGVVSNKPALMAVSRSLAAGQFIFVLISYLLLTTAFIQSDFTVALVANHSNTQLPLFYQITAVWGNHEGSLLLWVFILATWTIAVALFSKQLPLDMVARVLSVMGLISIGFILFTLFTSNPFERILPNAPLEGKDLNPLLQDPGMIFHPPMLYLGYVGFSVAFAFAIAALSSGRLDAAWARWSRPWTNVAWAFLTIGIALGSWWAYYELGWGGWWFWDPVENASFMPWISGAALIHSLAVTEKRGMFKSWTVLLAILTFSLSLLGTFLVRSGVLTSVHSFAADPTRGLFILGFLAVVVGGSLTLYAFRAPTVSSKATFGKLSREFFLLINNIILLVAMLTVLFGTLFPLIMDGLNLGKYSVGPPYFNAVFVPLMALLIVFMGIGPSSHWKKTEGAFLKAQLMTAAIASVVLAAVFPLFYGESYNVWAALAMCFALWLILSIVVDTKYKIRNAQSVWAGLSRLTPSYYGMVLGHVGLALCVIGVCLVSQYTKEIDLRMAPGDSVEASGYTFTFNGTQQIVGPNYTGDQGAIEVRDGDKLINVLKPEKRRYNASQSQVMTEASIDANLWRDLYVALGEPLGGGAWAVRVHYKPFVRWIWLGGIVMTLGGFISAMDKRYRVRAAKVQNEPGSVTAGAA